MKLIWIDVHNWIPVKRNGGLDYWCDHCNKWVSQIHEEYEAKYPNSVRD